MARTELTVQDIVRSGLEATYTAANGDGHYFSNDGKRTFIHVVNGDASDNTVTIQTPATADSLAITDRTVVVTAGEERMIGPFPTQYYNQSDGTVYVDHSNTTSGTIAAIKLPAE